MQMVQPENTAFLCKRPQLSLWPNSPWRTCKQKSGTPFNWKFMHTNSCRRNVLMLLEEEKVESGYESQVIPYRENRGWRAM
jgi:hypothetical protein